MIKHYFVFLILIIILGCDTTDPENPITETQLTSAQKEILTDLNANITECKTPVNLEDVNDITTFDQFANCKILGLGEATNGTKEFFRMKHKIFKYFVEKHGFKIFAFETSFAGSIYIDKFICENQGTIDEAIKCFNYFSLYHEEVKELILWMKQYNEGKSVIEKIHLIGVDFGGFQYGKDFLLNYFNKYFPNYPQNILNNISDIYAMSRSGTIVQMSQETLELYKSKCDSVYNFFDANKEIFINRSSAFEYEMMKRLPITAKQYFEYYHKNYETDQAGAYREFAMSQNAVWLTTLFGERTKCALWTHNMNVAKDPTLLNSGSLGYHINKTIGNDYKAVGFSFSDGSFRSYEFDGVRQGDPTVNSISQQLPGNSFNFVFKYAEPRNFILINDKISSSSKLFAWLNSKNKFLSIRENYYIKLFLNNFNDYNLFQSFDAIIHFKTSTDAVPYKSAIPVNE